MSEEQQFETQALEIQERSGVLAITNQATYDDANEFLRAMKDLKKKAEEHHNPIIKLAHETHKAATAALKKIVEPLSRAEFKVKTLMGGFLDEQERIEAERQRQADLDAKAEQEKEAGERAAQAELEGASKADVVAIKQEAKTPVSAPLVPPVVQQDKGVYRAKTYDVAVVSMKNLFNAVKANKVSIEALLPNLKYLKAQARATEGRVKIPGVKVIVNTGVRVR